jgi:predicted PurR-regulated permease PerM
MSSFPTHRGTRQSPPGKISAPLTLRRSLFALAAVAATIYLRDVWITGFLAVILAILLDFPVRLLGKIMPRGAATLLTLALGLAGAYFLTPLFLNPLADQARELEEKVPQALEQGRSWLHRTTQPAPGKPAAPAAAIAQGVEKKTQDLPGTIVSGAGSAILHATEFGTTLILLLALGLFFVHEPQEYRRWLRALVSHKYEKTFDTLWDRLEIGLHRWVRGVLIAMTLMGTFTAIGLKLAGVQNWLLLGALTFFGTFVPYVGAIASAIPGLIMALSQSGSTFLLASAVYAGVHVVEGYIVEPFVMKRAVTIHPAILLLWQATMGYLFGIPGIVVATPLYVCLKITLDTLYVERHLAKKPFPPLPEDETSAAA